MPGAPEPPRRAGHRLIVLRLLPLLASGLLACGGSPAAPKETALRYRVAVDPALRALDVRLCFEGPPPDRLVPGAAAGRALLHDATAAHVALPLDDRGLVLEGLSEGACVRYSVDLADLAALSESRGVGRLFAPDRVTWPHLWLWRPAKVAPDIDATLRFEPSPTVRVSQPWPMVVGQPGTVRLDWNAFTWRARVAFGRFDVRPIEVPGGTLRATVVGAPIAAGPEAVDAWLRRAGAGVAQVFGGFPAPVAQVVVLSVPGRGVHFGTSMRGGGAGVMLLVGSDSEATDLDRDWTATHELFHLGLPHVGDRDAWFAEGITTYYTYVAMARAGALSPAQAWSRIHDGFHRGRSRGSGRPLGDESAAMGHTGEYWRVYWGGAAFALLADVALRRQGGSLDQVVRYWSRWARTPGPAWHARALVERADVHFGRATLGPLADALLASAGFPEVRAAYAWLGLVPLDEAALRLAPAPGEAARRAVMGE